MAPIMPIMTELCSMQYRLNSNICLIYYVSDLFFFHNNTVLFFARTTAMYEPLGGVYIGSGDDSQRKPALFVVSCGEGHLDLRTADKVTTVAKDC